jgi:hypothetical protein
MSSPQTYRVDIYRDGPDWVAQISINGDENECVVERHLDTLLSDVAEIILNDEEAFSSGDDDLLDF